MIRLGFLVAWGVGLVVGLGCKSSSGGGEAPDARTPVDVEVATIDADTRCTSSAQCAAESTATPLCAPDGACVACLSNADCADVTAPTCDAMTHACRACAADADCDSGVCDLGEGSCIAASNIYYVDDDAGCGAGDGSAAMPFCSVPEALGVFAFAPRNYVRVAPGTYHIALLNQLSLPWIVGASDAVITAATPGTACVESMGPATLELRGFHFVGCTIGVAVDPGAGPAVIGPSEFDGGGRGLDCQSTCVVNRGTFHDMTKAVRCVGAGMCQIAGAHITATTDDAIETVGAQLSVTNVTITSPGASGIRTQDATASIVATTITGATAATAAGILCDGGHCAIAQTRVLGGAGPGVVILDAEYVIENSAFMGNGDTTAGRLWNGGVVISTTRPIHRFANDTVYGNHAGPGEIAGIRCESGGEILNSIVYANDGALQLTDGPTGCLPNACDLDQADAPGMLNFNADPMVTSATDPHLMMGSPCIDTAMSTGAAAVDIDGQTRPDGAAPDVGADEY